MAEGYINTTDRACYVIYGSLVQKAGENTLKVRKHKPLSFFFASLPRLSHVPLPPLQNISKHKIIENFKTGL